MLQKNKSILILVLVTYFMIFQACYSFRGISIDPEVNTFFVENFELNADNVEPNLNLTFTERLKDKIRLESRLKYTETDPDIEFSGAIVGYDVTAIAPQPGETTAFNRLRITVFVEYKNNKKEEDTWEQRFPFFADFSSDENLINIQDELISTINNQLVEDIFNKAFNNW